MAFDSQKRAFSIGGPVLLIVLLALSLACMIFYAREGDEGPLHTVQNNASYIVSPLKFVGAIAGQLIDQASEAAEDASADEETLSALREANSELREQLAQLEEYAQEAQRLEALLELRDSYDFDSVAARVIGQSTDSWNQVITIDVGSDDGVRSGLPVMGASGVIGMVISTTASTAEVRLITDPQSGVAAMVQSSRVQGIVSGSLEGVLYFEDFETDSEISVGDVITNSGIGGSYFGGLMIGTVTRVEQTQNGTITEVVVTQNSEASALEEVLVVLSLNDDADGGDEE